MGTPPQEVAVRCANCSAIIHVAADWRLAQCPACGHITVRMEDDPAYD